MNSTLDAALRSWPAAPWLLSAIVVSAAVYTRGWIQLRRRAPRRWHCGRLAAFYGGLATIYLALASPIEAFNSLLLSVHMLQHVLLMMVAPPLVWLGGPMLPMLRGLPEPVRKYWIAPLFRNRAVRWLATQMTRPGVALALFVGATWAWHWPAAYQLALVSPEWHVLEHVCFFGTGLLFWYPVVRPYPSRLRSANWILLPYLILADLQNTVLSALFAFSHTLIYPYYAAVPRIGGLSPIADQQAAGVIMWVPGSIVYLVPLVVVGFRLLQGEKRYAYPSPPAPLPQGERGGRGTAPPAYFVRGSFSPSFGRTADESACSRRAVSMAPSIANSRGRRFDLLRVPIVGRFLKWRRARLALQIPMLLLAAIVIYDGLHGPQVSAMNLAGVLPWVHWRGLLILSLLVAGNVFCMACPFMVPRTFARRLFAARFDWPVWLRSKWLAVGLIGLFLWAYEAFSLWDSPWWTAWIAIGYFVAAFAVDCLFRGAAFCKYVCPIGQFNFVQSLISPLEIAVREPAKCTACTTRECIRGGDGIAGCELQLYLPRKASNMDCTFCLDCIRACPHDNIGILSTRPPQQLWSDRLRSGIGRFSGRADLAALVLVLVFGAFANAAGMVGPIVELEQALQERLGLASIRPVITMFYLLALVVAPLLLVGVAVLASRTACPRRAVGMAPREIALRTATRFSFSLMPLGFAMWLAHYSFHLFGSYDAAIPVAQRFAADMGMAGLGSPQWICSCCRPAADWILRWEILCLDVGLLLSLYTAWRIAKKDEEQQPRNTRIHTDYEEVNESRGTWQNAWHALPWAVLIVLLFAAGVWIVLQPMQMRV